jgi:hypothetical protein
MDNNPGFHFAEGNAPPVHAPQHPQPAPQAVQSPQISLFRISNSLLRGGWPWRIWCWICTALTIAIMVLFLVMLDGDRWMRLGFVIFFFLLVSSVIWLSVQARDGRKRDLFAKHGAGIPDLLSKSQAVGNIIMRKVAAAVFLIASLIFFVLLIALSDLDGQVILNFCIVSLLIMSTAFQQTKAAHDVTDGNLLKDTLKSLGPAGGHMA